MRELTTKPHLFTVEEYTNSNVPAHTELVGGIIYDVSPSSPAHAYAVQFLGDLFRAHLDGTIHQVRETKPVAIEGWKGREAPEPDIAVVRQGDYRKDHPTAADTFAAIEVSVTTYDHDRDDKIPVYVAAGVPSWLVNIPERRVECYPPHDLDRFTLFLDGQSFDVLGVTVKVSDLLPVV